MVYLYNPLNHHPQCMKLRNLYISHLYSMNLKHFNNFSINTITHNSIFNSNNLLHMNPSMLYLCILTTYNLLNLLTPYNWMRIFYILNLLLFRQMHYYILLEYIINSKMHILYHLIMIHITLLLCIYHMMMLFAYTQLNLPTLYN